MLLRKYVKAFKCMLALSNTKPSHLPKAMANEGVTFIPDSLVLENWISSIMVFGFTKETKKMPIVFLMKAKVAPTTSAWKERETTSLKGFTKDTMYKEGNDGVHDTCRSTKNKFLKDGNKKSHWLHCFTALNNKTENLNDDEHKALEFAMCLA